MDDEDYYNNKAFDELVEIKDNVSNQDPDSFNKEIDRIYQDHKGKLISEENNVNRPVSKIMVRRIVSAEVNCTDEELSKIIISINKQIAENKLRRDHLIFSENLLLKLEQFRQLLLVDLKCQLSNLDINKLFTSLSSNTEGVVYTSVFFDKLNFSMSQQHSSPSGASIKDDANENNAISPCLTLNPNTISQQMISKKNIHFNEKVSMQFKKLNKEINELISIQPTVINPFLKKTNSLKKDAKKKIQGLNQNIYDEKQNEKKEFRTTTLPTFNLGRPQTSLAARNTTSMTKYLKTEVIQQAKPSNDKNFRLTNTLKESKTKVSR